MKALRIAVLLPLLALLLLPGCKKPPAQDLPVVRYVNFRVYDPVYVALEKGMFASRGIELQIVGDVLAGPTAIQAVSSGMAEAGLSSIPALINANAAGLPVQGVTDIQSALPGQPLEYYYVRADSPIQTTADLEGAHFAVNLWFSSFHYTALMELEKQCIDPDSLQWSLLAFKDQALSLAEGRVDVIGLMEPYNTMALEMYSDQFRLLFDAEDVFGTKQFTLHFVNRVWAESNPETARAFAASIQEAIAWIEANQDAAKPIIAKYTEIEEQYIPIYHFQPDGRVIEEDVAWWIEYMRARGDLALHGSAADWVTPELIASNKYLD